MAKKKASHYLRLNSCCPILKQARSPLAKLTSDVKSITDSAPTLKLTTDLTNDVAKLNDPSISQAALLSTTECEFLFHKLI